MATLISLIIVAIGIANWFSIGAFQYDFVAGLFGSQANIFSRLVYVIVGIAGVFLAYSIIRNKGKLIFKNKTDKELFTFGKKAKVNAESAKDNSINSNGNEIENDDEENIIEDKKYMNQSRKNQNTESAHEITIDNDIQSRANRINDKNKLSSKNYYTESAKDAYRHNRNNTNK